MNWAGLSVAGDAPVRVEIEIVDGLAYLADDLALRIIDVAHPDTPIPIGRLETLPGSSGIMADDMLAGIYANLVLQGFVWAFPAWWGVS